MTGIEALTWGLLALFVLVVLVGVAEVCHKRKDDER